MGQLLHFLLYTLNNLLCIVGKKREFMKVSVFAILIAVATPIVGFAETTPPALQNDPSASLDATIKQFKDARDVASMKAYEAGSNADQYLGQSWTDYQQAIRKQELYQRQVKLLDEKIAELEKQKSAVQKH